MDQLKFDNNKNKYGWAISGVSEWDHVNLSELKPSQLVLVVMGVVMYISMHFVWIAILENWMVSGKCDRNIKMHAII